MKIQGSHLLIFAMTLLIGVLCYYNGLLRQRQRPAVSRSVMMMPPPPPRVPYRRPQRRSPEFRGPPYKAYKPGVFQQMGLLVGDAGTIMPLFGKESPGYRDRYNYYTNSPGQQLYSLPVSYDNKDCTEDIGCPEFYGNENLAVTDMTETFSVKNYKNYPY